MSEEPESTPRERTPLGRRIVELRDAAGWGQRRLAKETGLSPVTVVHIETGQTPEPRLSTVRKIAEAFGMTTNELLVPKARARPLSREWLNDRTGHAYLSRTSEECIGIVKPLRTEAEVTSLREAVRDEVTVLDESFGASELRARHAPAPEGLDPELWESLREARRTAIDWFEELAKQRNSIRDAAAVSEETSGDVRLVSAF